MSGAIVIHGHVQGLAYVRSLGKRGIPIMVLDITKASLASRSRYCRFFSLVDPFQEEKFVDFIFKLSKKFKNWILIPTHDEELVALSKRLDLLEKDFIATFPGWEVISNFVNKDVFYDKLKGIVPMPKSIIPDDIFDVKRISKELNYPAIIKPSIGHIFYFRTKSKCIFIHSPKDLIKKFKWISKIDHKPIIQEHIPGPSSNLYSFCAIIDKKQRLRGAFTGRKIRQCPNDFGTATLCESTWTPEIMEYGLKVLRENNYYGIAEVEFKYDSKDNEYKLLEVNARGWKWISLAIASGVDFPHILYSTFTEENGSTDVKTAYHKKIGVKWLFIPHDAYLLLKTLRSGNINLKELIKWTQPIFQGRLHTAAFSNSDSLPLLNWLINRKVNSSYKAAFY
ncbi:MAG: hypothetical protein NWF08_06555 [Candidatus Bathyarchaeota archaeon]|nr:hypothetical protein [Candidatus Bathyarchaeota archaeon]